MFSVENCGHWVQKRNQKLENFFKKTAFEQQFGAPRYYEGCVVDVKGSLVFRNVIVTNHFVAFTANPPKSVILSIPLAAVKDVQLVADRHSLIKGVGFVSQHVRLCHVHSPMSTTKTKTKKDNNQNGDSGYKSSSSRRTSPPEAIYESELNSNNHHDSSDTASSTTTEQSSSRQSSRLDHCAFVPLSIIQEYEPIVVPLTLTNSLPPSVSEQQSNPNNKESKKKEEDEWLDFYMYLPNSTLLNELSLSWKRRILKWMLQQDALEWERTTPTKLVGAEKAFSRLVKSWSELSIGTSPLNFNVLLSKLCAMHKSLMKFDGLGRIFWKEWDTAQFLVRLLEHCMKSDKNNSDESFVDKITTVGLIFDVFRLLYESSVPSWFGETKTHNNINNSLSNNDEEEEVYFEGTFSQGNLRKVTLTLTGFIFNNIIMPPAEAQIIKSPTKFAEGQWTFFTHAKAIKAITTTHNASVALLHEILSTIHLSPKDKERAKFMFNMKSWNLEPYLNLSMTQTINLLWANGRQIGASQSVLLYRHVHVAQILIDNVSSAKQFLRENFNEEFRYFVHGKSAKTKIPHHYPIKEKLVNMCEQLRNDIIHNNN